MESGSDSPASVFRCLTNTMVSGLEDPLLQEQKIPSYVGSTTENVCIPSVSTAWYSRKTVDISAQSVVRASCRVLTFCYMNMLWLPYELGGRRWFGLGSPGRWRRRSGR